MPQQLANKHVKLELYALHKFTTYFLKYCVTRQHKYRWWTQRSNV